MSRIVKPWLKWLVLGLVCAMEVLAVAQSTDAWGAGPAAGGKQGTAFEEARRRMERGQGLFSQGRYQEALGEFQAAYDTLPYGAFLYNAALSADKAGDRARAIALYRRFLMDDPGAPDAPEIRATVERLQRELATAVPPADADAGPDAAASESDGGLSVDGGASETDAGVPVVAPVATSPTPADAQTLAEVRSLVFVDTEPPGAPLSIYERTSASEQAFPANAGGDAPAGWRRIVSGVSTPHDLSLRVGDYHVVIEPFQDFKRSETDIRLASGHVYIFKANLSQGSFLGFVDVKSPVEGARIYLDDPPPHKNAPWGRAPHGGLLTTGAHQLWIEAPGYEPFTAKIAVKHGQTVSVEAKLGRVSHGFLRISANASEIEVEVDGEPRGTWQSGAVPLRVKVPAGTHQLGIDASGRNKYQGEVEVPRGQEVPIEGHLIESRSWATPITLAVLAAGAAAGGVVFNRISAGETDPSKHDIYYWVGNGFFIGGGALALASIVSFIYDPTEDSLARQGKPRDLSDEEPRKSARSLPAPSVVPMVGASSGGVGVAGVF
jgi:tetratricopeptide (TPR) repeat protein